ncbi:MAG: hypothetical protein CBC83_00745 [Flavobacteriales bacterium TMED123]|nr:MAG: hypothetical protein CBC83_00745 [Flavobacteriales bacterium TMED123]
MSKKIYFLILTIIPFLAKASDTTLTKNTISWNSKINLESNALTIDFISRMLGGGFISDTQKNNWISKLSENNTLFSEFSNNISYNRISGKNSFSFSVADRNLARIAFTGDLMKVALFGNYNYQGDTLLFDKTNLNLTRFQQVKIGYGREFKIQDKTVKVSTALSYLNGNQHLSFLSEKASFYTAPYGTYNDLEYDITAFATDTANFNYFENNGSGVAFDFELNFQLKEKKYSIYLFDLGYINWKESALKYNTDTTYSFKGFEIDNLLEFNDSLLEKEADQYLEDIYLNAKKDNIKSYIPANFGLKIEAPLNDLYFNKYIFGVNLKWQPYQDNMLLSLEKILQGFYESGYSPYFYLKTYKQYKGALLIPQIAIGGYTQKLSFGLTTQFFKKSTLQLGCQHLESVFKGKDSNALSVYLQMRLKF